MGSIFRHRHPAPTARTYEHFRAAIREDFSECCAFCLMHELGNGGRGSYELDHFRPKSKFPLLATEYTNIYYTCRVCNKNKHHSWPSDKMLSLDIRFVDPCRELFSDHFVEESAGLWRPLTQAGKYTEARLQLNRDDLVALRLLLLRICAATGEPPIDWDRPVKSQVSGLLSRVGVGTAERVDGGRQELGLFLDLP